MNEILSNYAYFKILGIIFRYLAPILADYWLSKRPALLIILTPLATDTIFLFVSNNHKFENMKQANHFQIKSFTRPAFPNLIWPLNPFALEEFLRNP